VNSFLQYQNGGHVWLVGQIRAIYKPVTGFDGPHQAWEVSGVYPTKEQAVLACRDWTYFVAGPFVMGQQILHETVSDPPAFFPIKRPMLPGEID